MQTSNSSKKIILIICLLIFTAAGVLSYYYFYKPNAKKTNTSGTKSISADISMDFVPGKVVSIDVNKIEINDGSKIYNIAINGQTKFTKTFLDPDDLNSKTLDISFSDIKTDMQVTVVLTGTTKDKDLIAKTINYIYSNTVIGNVVSVDENHLLVDVKKITDKSIHTFDMKINKNTTFYRIINTSEDGTSGQKRYNMQKIEMKDIVENDRVYVFYSGDINGSDQIVERIIVK